MSSANSTATIKVAINNTIEEVISGTAQKEELFLLDLPGSKDGQIINAAKKMKQIGCSYSAKASFVMGLRSKRLEMAAFGPALNTLYIFKFMEKLTKLDKESIYLGQIAQSIIESKNGVRVVPVIVHETEITDNHKTAIEKLVQDLVIIRQSKFETITTLAEVERGA